MTPEVKRSSELRRTVMRSFLSMARKTLFHDFAHRDAEDMENADVVTDADGNPVLPIWLLLKENERSSKKRRTAEEKRRDSAVKYSFNGKTVADAVSQNEQRKEPKVEFNYRNRIVKRGYPKRVEMGHYAMNYLYHSLLKTFTKTRRPAKLMFFNLFGYLFMDWTTCAEVEVKDSSVYMRWAAPMGVSALETWDSDEITASLTYKESTDNLENGNMDAYSDFARAADDVVLLVKHDVLVRTEKAVSAKTDNQRRRIGDTKKVWNKAINLMELVVRVLEPLCGFTSAHPVGDILRAH